MRFPVVLLLLSGCGSNYIRHTDLHHAEYISSLKVINKKECRLTVESKSDQATTKVYNYVLCPTKSDAENNDSCLVFLENKQVIYFSGSYWVKKSSPDHLHIKYSNRCVNF